MSANSATTAASNGSASSPKKINAKLNVFSHIKYEHMVAGISGEFTLLDITRKSSLLI